MEKEERIIKGALDLFLQAGVKSINMDDVSTHLGISKKTLYKIVSNKADLVKQAFTLHQSSFISMIEAIKAKNTNPIDEIFEIDQQLCVMLKNRPPLLISNLKKYYPEVWNILDTIRKENIYDCVSQNIDLGIKQGFYRGSINVNIIAKLMINTVEAIVDDELFPLTEYNFKNILQENRVYHIRGIATQKGINYLENKLQND
ncbi:MAG: TetR/AcrR family transcriptional regulator [Flavobacteriales bacterium]|jgi:AcrR family transcriptional regulator|tara:strand:- start:4333 stop:4938 length:606 start_codon:yes stop_codon:yes gene_type:complete